MIHHLTQTVLTTTYQWCITSCHHAQLSWLGEPPRTVYTADPDLTFSTHAKFDYTNVDETGAISSTEWPSSGITLWFLREPFDPLLSHKETVLVQVNGAIPIQVQI